ncbi:dihydrolipoyl dehydrogenase family protein [Scytonema sp. NUACC26]|uniref:dihydrolipoyl dehydrogenase family protein n=1 Tax=Scytonema sp. NUACC26 TaxID=3140176 RepID=UPI0038B3A258
MTNDYDIVIIGGSLVGRFAALSATQLRAKVALVEPTVNGKLYLANALYGFVYHQAFSHISDLARQFDETFFKGVRISCGNNEQKCQISVDTSQALLYSDGIISKIQEQHSPAILAAQGVDVIVGDGQFQPSPTLTFVVNDRQLRARTYLLATGSRPKIPDIEGLQKIGFLTIPDVWQSLNRPAAPKQWAIFGGVPQSIEIAQTLAHLNYDVTLIVAGKNILPQIDFEISQLLCSQLEAEGVRIVTQAPVTQVRRIENKKWLQVGDKAIETDEIVVVTAQQPNIESLNLAAVDVKWDCDRLLVNDKLQTTNRRIWACGDVIGGYEIANIARYEARVAIQNALFFSKQKVNYQQIPWGIFTHPTVAQVGLTEAQAKRQYNRDKIIVLRQYFKSIASAQIQDETTGLCKLITLDRGEILGASILGAKAMEFIHVIALAIAQKITVTHLARIAPLYPSFSEILEQTALSWNQHKLNSDLAWQDFLESFFHFRRNWNL